VATYYVDSKFIAADNAVIPINDLALLRGYGVFDFLRTYSGQPIFLRAHIQRLAQSAKQIGLDLSWSQKELIDIVKQTLSKNKNRESNIRIVVTGGPSPDFITPHGKPRLLVLVTPLTEQPERWYTDGVKIITINSVRNIPGAKSIDYIPATIALKQARRKKAIEAVYVDRDECVLEGTTSNLFIFRGDRLITPGRAILSGITRKVVLRLASNAYQTDIRDIARDELYAADEVFITGSNREIVPVVKVDKKTIGDGQPGTRTKKMMEAFATYMAEEAQSHKLR
jgi:branched-chain amino acid aminotransferase